MEVRNSSEFAHLNSTSQRAQLERPGLSRPALGSVNSADDSHQGREASHTSRAASHTSREHLTDSQLRESTHVAQLPEASAAREREKLVRKLEICAAVRAQSARKMSHRCSQREVVKNQMLAERRRHHERIYSSAREREDRWSRRLHRSPFTIDLLAENQRIQEMRERELEEQKQLEAHNRARAAQDALFRRVTDAEKIDVRAERRQLLEKEKHLKALRAVEKSSNRMARILEDRRRQQTTLDEVSKVRPVERFPQRPGRLLDGTDSPGSLSAETHGVCTTPSERARYGDF